MKLRWHLIIFALLTLLPVVLFAIGMMAWNASIQRQQSQRIMNETTRALALALDRELGKSEALLKALASSPLIDAKDFGALHRQARELDGGGWITLIKPNGEQLLNTLVPYGQPLPGAANAARLRELVEAKRTNVSNLFVGAAAKRPIVSVGVPVVRNGVGLYSMDIAFGPERFTELLREQRLPEGWHATIFDANGTIIARTLDPEKQVGQPASPEFSEKIKRDPEGFTSGTTREGVPVLGAWRRASLSGWTVNVGAPQTLIEAPLMHSLRLAVGGGLAFLVFGTLMAVVFGRGIARPIAVLAAQADSMAKGNLVPQGPELKISELQRVQSALLDASIASRQRAAEREQMAAQESASAERARSEAELRRAAAFNEAIMSNLAEGLYTIDERGLMTSMNPAAEELFGWRFAELRGKNMHDIMHHHDADGTPLLAEHCPVLRVLATGAKLVGQEDMFIRKDGTFFPVEYSISPMREVADEITGAVVVFSDISERKRTETALRTTTQRLDSALGNSPLAVIEWTTEEFRIQRWSDEATRVFGWTAEEAIGHRIDELPWIYEEDVALVREVMADMLSGKRPRNVNKNRNVRKDGAVIHCEWYNSAVADTSGKLVSVLSLVLDVTERKRAEEALEGARSSAERARADAENANHAKDHFLAVLSHELRTPLTPVLAAVQLLQRRPGLSNEASGPLEIIQRNIQLQARLIDDLLDLTRIAQGKLELKLKPIDVATVIERAVEIAKPDIEARRLEFAVTVKDAPHWVNGDASRLQQVVWNLLTNAIKFTPEGGCVGLCCQRTGLHVVIEISDSGIGIEPEAQGRIFDAFEQGGRAITRQFGGLGLGLAIVKRLVEVHEGRVSVYSEGRSRGAMFRVELPLISAARESSDQEKGATVDGRSKCILLVEDNDDTALTMQLLLETYGYEVKTSGSVGQALAMLESRYFDLLVSDLGLPDGSGIDLMRELRSRGNSIKGIAISGFGQAEDMRRSREAGFSAHLVKPADVDLIVETIARMSDSADGTLN